VNAPATSAPARRISLALVLAASLALSLFLALRLPLLDPDEGRNAEVAREMAVSGDLVIPHLAGMPYLDKPPGFFWAAALSIRGFGPTPLAARLPSILAALALLALLGRAARRAGGERFGWIAPALLAAAPLFAALAAYVIFDMMLALCVTIVWLGLAREVEEAGGDEGASSSGPARLRRRLLMFAAIAAGILIKGPVMLGWALGGSLGAALLTRSRASLAWLVWWPGWILALGIPGAWFAAATARFPEYPHYAFLEESLERLTSNSFHRQQPWWFVPAVLVGGTLPWSLLTRWSRARLEASAPAVNVAAGAGVGFMLFAAVFFTLSHSKLVTYLLPALPPLAWCAAATWAGPATSGARRLALVISLSLAPAAVIVAAWAGWLRDSPLLAGGAPLARAVIAAGSPALCYQRCYSPGTDFLLGRASPLVSTRGEEITSNYVVRYRDALMARGEWRLLDRVPRDFAGILVRSARDTSGTSRLERVWAAEGQRFVAYRAGASMRPAAQP